MFVSRLWDIVAKNILEKYSKTLSLKGGKNLIYIFLCSRYQLVVVFGHIFGLNGIFSRLAIEKKNFQGSLSNIRSWQHIIWNKTFYNRSRNWCRQQKNQNTSLWHHIDDILKNFTTVRVKKWMGIHWCLLKTLSFHFHDEQRVSNEVKRFSQINENNLFNIFIFYFNSFINPIFAWLKANVHLYPIIKFLSSFSSRPDKYSCRYFVHIVENA